MDLPLNSGAMFTTTNSNVNGILGGYMSVNGYTDWAANDGTGNIVAFSSYNTDNYSSAANNVDVTNGAALLSVSTPTTVNSLRFNTANIGNGGNLDLNGQVLTLNTGGILVTPKVSGGALAITDGTLTASGGAGNPGNDLVVLQGNTTTPFTIGASIANNGTTSIGLTKGGPGALVLTGQNTYSGPTTIAAGSLQGSLGRGQLLTQYFRGHGERRGQCDLHGKRRQSVADVSDQRSGNSHQGRLGEPLHHRCA